MQNVKTKLWSGAILIQQDSLPGLSQRDEISVDIFHEEASKQNRVNFDWASSTRKIAKFWRFPKGSLKSKKPEANLLPFIKDSAIVKLSLPDGEDHSKFASLVECLAKVGKEAFCGFLRVEEDDLRPLCLMVTERGLLGFCVDSVVEDPNISDEVHENSTALFSKFEKTLKENFAAGNGKSKVRKEEMPEEKVDIEDLLNLGSEDVQLSTGEKLSNVSGGGTSDGDKPVNENTAPLVEDSSELQVTSQVDNSQESISNISSDHSLYPHEITKTSYNSSTFNLQAVPTFSVKEEAMEIARSVLSKPAVQTCQEKSNMGCENESELQMETNDVVDVSEDIVDWTSSEVVVNTDNSKRIRNCTISGVVSTSRNPSIKEKALALARNVLIQNPVQEDSYKDDWEQFSKANKDLVTKNLPFNHHAAPVLPKSPNASSSYSELPFLSAQPSPASTFPNGGSFIVDGKDPKALKIYSTTNEKGTEVLHPVYDHDYASATMKVPQNQKKKEPGPKNLFHYGTSQESPGVSSVAKYLFNQNHVKDVVRKEIIRPAIDLEKAERGKEYFTRKFASIGLSRMKEMKSIFFKYLNKETSSAEFIKNSKLTESSQVTSATTFLETNFPHLREAILIGKVKIPDLHWIFNDTLIDHNGVIADAEGNKKENEDQKLSKPSESHHLATTLVIPLKYQGHAECKISIRQDSFKEYLAIFTKHHVLFCNKSIRLPLKLVQDYSLQNKVWNEGTEGKVYLPDMIFPTKLNEVHFFVVQDSQSFKEKILNLGNLQESSSLMTKEDFLKSSLALTEENPGILMNWNMINPSNEECLLLNNDTSVFLSEVNEITSSPQELIDLFHDSIERLVDVPGIDDEIALKIYKVRIQSKTLVNFIQKENFGFELLTEIVQLDVGLLARKDLALCYNGATMNSNSRYLKILEQNLFQKRFVEWRRPDNIPCIVMVAVLGFLSGRHVTRPRAHVLKYLIEKQEGSVEKSWVKFSKFAISFMEGPVLLQVNTTAKVSPSQKFDGNNLKITNAALKKISPSKLKEELKKGVYPRKIGRSIELKAPKQCDVAGKKTSPNLLAVLNMSTTPKNNNNNEANVCCDNKKKVEKPNDQTMAKQTGSLQVKALNGIEDISRRKDSSSGSAKSESSSVGLDIVGRSVRFSNASPEKLATNLNPPPKHPSLAMPVVSLAPDISKCSLECTKQSSIALSPVLASSTSCSYSPPGSPVTASTSIFRIGESYELTDSSSLRNTVTADIDAKLFLKTSVEVEKLSSTELTTYVSNKNKEDNDDIVTLDEAFDNYQLYVEPILAAVENLLPSLEFKLKPKNKDSKKAMLDCSLCKKVFSDHEDRHQHYMSVHAGRSMAVELSENQFECKLCYQTFIDWQGRHEHYMAVHC